MSYASSCAFAGMPVPSELADSSLPLGQEEIRENGETPGNLP